MKIHPMKVELSAAEVGALVTAHLQGQGYKVNKTFSLARIEETGSYSDRTPTAVFVGFAAEVEVEK